MVLNILTKMLNIKTNKKIKNKLNLGPIRIPD
jgi:hypothetical protein